MAGSAACMAEAAAAGFQVVVGLLMVARLGLGRLERRVVGFQVVVGLMVFHSWQLKGQLVARVHWANCTLARQRACVCVCMCLCVSVSESVSVCLGGVSYVYEPACNFTGSMPVCKQRCPLCLARTAARAKEPVGTTADSAAQEQRQHRERESVVLGAWRCPFGQSVLQSAGYQGDCV